MLAGASSMRALGDLATISASAPAWERLLDSHGTMPTQSADWAEAAVHAFVDDGRVRVAVLGGDEDLDGIAPLVARRGRLELLGLAELYEPTDLLARSGADLERLCEGLARLHLPLRFERLPGESPTVAALRSAYGRRARVIVREAPPWPSLTLGEAWTELGGGLSPRRRSDLRRAMRRAETQGPVSARLLHPAIDDVPALLDAAFEIEARSWKGASGTALAQDRRRAAFFRRYAASAAARGRLRVAFLDIGDRAAAMQIGIEWHGSVWLLKIGYDEAHARCSPGLLLLAHTIRDAAQQGLDTFELLGTTDDWVRPWTTVERPAVAVSVYPAHPRAVPGAARGLAAVARRRGRSAVRQAARASKAAAERVAAARYLAGPRLEDALRVEAETRARGLLTTVGYWNADEDSADLVLGEYRAQIAGLAGQPDPQISIKVRAIGDDVRVVSRLLDGASEADVGVHFDSLAPETQPVALDIACRLAQRADGRLGCTLPGRWPRSVADAERVADCGLRVRVVKSEWPSAEDPDRDPRRGFLEVVDALVAAGATHVAVATHDAPLAARALRTLRAAGTACELQVLHGMRAGAVMGQARAMGVPIRLYVPYGHGRLPYSVEEAAGDPRVAARLARDLVRRNRSL